MAASAVLSILLSFALLSVGCADSKKCIALKFIAKAWLPALDSSNGIAEVQKWPKNAIIKLRIIIDQKTVTDHDIAKIQLIKSQITSWFQLANLGVRFLDKGDVDYVLVMTTDVEGYIGEQFGYLTEFLLSSPAVKESLASLAEGEQAKILNPVVVAERIKRSGGCGSLYIASNSLILRAYSLIDINQSMLCAQVAVSEAIGAWNAPSFAYLMNASNETVADEKRSFFLSKSVAELYNDKIKVGSSRAGASENLEEMCK